MAALPLHGERPALLAPPVVTVTLSLPNFALAGRGVETEATEVRSDSWSRGCSRGCRPPIRWSVRLLRLEGRLVAGGPPCKGGALPAELAAHEGDKYTPGAQGDPSHGCSGCTVVAVDAL